MSVLHFKKSLKLRSGLSSNIARQLADAQTAIAEKNSNGPKKSTRTNANGDRTKLAIRLAGIVDLKIEARNFWEVAGILLLLFGGAAFLLKLVANLRVLGG